MLQAADITNVPVSRLGVSRFAEYLGSAGAGRIGVAALLCVLVCTLVAALAYRRSAAWPTVPVLVAAALALIARPVTGHMSQQALGSLLDAAHALAAALWFGTLVALALTVRSRGAWARLLPGTRCSRCDASPCSPRRASSTRRYGSARSRRSSTPDTAASCWPRR